jgi:hypothetical protein
VSASFSIRVYNESDDTRTFRVQGTTPKVASRAHYYLRGADVTRELESAGGMTVSIEPHHYIVFGSRLTLGPWAMVTATLVYVSATWVGHPDHTDRVRAGIVFVD